MSGTSADVAILRASWQRIRDGRSKAWQDARELIAHRRVLVNTTARTKQGEQVVLCTRLRLIGDTQTDVLRTWIRSATAKEAAMVSEAHFRAVDAAMAGWSAARAMERVLARLTGVAGGAVSVLAVVQKLLATPQPLLLHAIMTSWALWGGAGLTLLGTVLRWLIRRRLCALFRRGLSGVPT